MKFTDHASRVTYHASLVTSPFPTMTSDFNPFQVAQSQFDYVADELKLIGHVIEL